MDPRSAKNVFSLAFAYCLAKELISKIRIIKNNLERFVIRGFQAIHPPAQICKHIDYYFWYDSKLITFLGSSGKIVNG